MSGRRSPIPILEWSGPDAFEVIEDGYVDPERVDHDTDGREQYEFCWRRPRLRRRRRKIVTVKLARPRAVAVLLAIGVAIAVVAYCLWPQEPVAPEPDFAPNIGSWPDGEARGIDMDPSVEPYLVGPAPKRAR